MSKKRIIVTNEYDADDYKESFEEWCEINDLDPEDYSLEDYAARSVDTWLEDEVRNLSKTPCGKLLVIAELGLWYGTRSGYKIINADRLSDIFTLTLHDTFEYYCDRYDVKVKDVHHDGTNFYTIREIKEGKERALKNLCEKIYNQEEVTSAEISRCTRSIRKKVANIYGW